ncbi:MAG: hypothetical protein A2Z95_05765 [Gallionellales bacterium GWA2_60_18]|nr:MAG: hypothetical protein A2Z95_05765 [Gallionellales bacterium GWA2_60_18]
MRLANEISDKLRVNIQTKNARSAIFRFIRFAKLARLITFANMTYTNLSKLPARSIFWGVWR